MRIAFVSDHASPLAPGGSDDTGGQNVYVDCLSRALADRGHDVVVFTRRDHPLLPTDVVTPHGVTVVHVDAGPPGPIDKDDLFPYMDEFAMRVGDRVGTDAFDVVHSHFWMSAHATRSVAERAGIPWVHNFHALGTVKRRHQGRADRSPAIRARVERMVLGRADAVVATCTDEVRELRAIAPARRLEVVPCGFDARLFTDALARPSADRLRICAVSRLVPRKGVADVIAAMRLVPSAELVIAGGSAPRTPLAPHEQELRSLVDRHHLADRVRFVGSVDRAQVAGLHRASDLFVAAPWYEPFGIAPVEAMGSGLPVVATAVGGMLDTVLDGVTGLLVPARDPGALAEALARLASDPELRHAMGRAAARRAHRDYSWETVAARIDAIYRSLVEHADAGSADPFALARHDKEMSA